MLSYLARLVLILTSLSPFAGAVALRLALVGKSPWHWGPWVVGALASIGVCVWMLQRLESRPQEQRLSITTFERQDKEALTFLVAYMLPLLSVGADVPHGWAIYLYVLLVVALIVAHADAFHFNPVMGLLGYHFFTIRDDTGGERLLISRKPIRRSEQCVKATQLVEGVYLYKEPCRGA